jgi:hypothetical protein
MVVHKLGNLYMDDQEFTVFSKYKCIRTEVLVLSVLKLNKKLILMCKT